ncbi:MAG: type II toxin-antitoxin system PemK/MazF family toxin [bacterium]|nr:type II toxin-antitoxin system PemK/MazF family toxin [bacterium]MXV89298.1 type II toxin-antitoxin system PemK/MazF family toxin [Acidimicrobiia bacterium]MYC46469.1 type II toxin-antitoxin system PemK/MazF family toxin [Acidimicrobiia bacterium]MYI19618.1 type II toxin-antitoxin system PemK/MazF family toxin [Acidimicrobiia bacterium]
MVAQGELWLMEPPNQKRRPALVVSRDEAIPVLNNVVVAPVTSTIRSIPTCVPVGPDEGIDRDSVVSFDNLATVPKSVLTLRLGQLDGVGRLRMCDALRAMADC